MARKSKHRHHPGRLNSVTACISTMMVLILVGTIVFVGTMADNLGRSLKENFTVEVLLDDEIPVKEAYKLQTELRQMPYTKFVSYTSKEKATRLQAEAMGDDPNEFLGESPIPASFELHLQADYANTDSLDKFMPSLKNAVGVTDVVYPEDLMGEVNNNIRKVSIVLLVIALLLGIVSISLINNTMRLSVAQRRHSIQTMKLVGAKWSFIRRPFIRRALWMGLIAGILADLIIFGGIQALNSWDPQAQQIITPWVIGLTLLSVLIFGVVLTVVCAFFSVNKHLSMTREEANLY